MIDLSDEELRELFDRLLTLLTPKQLKELDRQLNPYRQLEVSLRPEDTRIGKQFKGLPNVRFIEFDSCPYLNEMPLIKISHTLRKKPIGFIPLDYDPETQPRMIKRSANEVCFTTKASKGKVRGILF